MTTLSGKHLLVAAILATASFSSHAADPRSGVVSNIGNWIAAQGNHAFREIRNDLEQDLTEKLKPLLPAALEREQKSGTTGNDDTAA